jgi:hypothetical protein
MVIAPPLPCEADFVRIDITPESILDAPVLSASDPLAPAIPASADWMLISPLVVAMPHPLCRAMDPPVAVELEPAEIVALPPLPLLPAPTQTSMLPA